MDPCSRQQAAGCSICTSHKKPSSSLAPSQHGQLIFETRVQSPESFVLDNTESPHPLSLRIPHHDNAGSERNMPDYSVFGPRQSGNQAIRCFVQLLRAKLILSRAKIGIICIISGCVKAKTKVNLIAV